MMAFLPPPPDVQTPEVPGHDYLGHADMEDGTEAPVFLRRRKGVRRLTLRLDEKRRFFVVTAPLRSSLPSALGFAFSHRPWMRLQWKKIPASVPFGHGASVPFLGQPLVIRHMGQTRDFTGPSRRHGEELQVRGAQEHLPRRVRDYLISAAKAHIRPLAHRKAESIEARISALTFRDMSSRWGSCSTGGRVSFSWRLIMAPEFVVDYVVAHEVAHLRHMNHSRQFWTLCRELTPHAEEGRKWLKMHGRSLMAFGG